MKLLITIFLWRFCCRFNIINGRRFRFLLIIYCGLNYLISILISFVVHHKETVKCSIVCLKSLAYNWLWIAILRKVKFSRQKWYKSFFVPFPLVVVAAVVVVVVVISKNLHYCAAPASGPRDTTFNSHHHWSDTSLCQSNTHVISRIKNKQILKFSEEKNLRKKLHLSILHLNIRGTCLQILFCFKSIAKISFLWIYFECKCSTFDFYIFHFNGHGFFPVICSLDHCQLQSTSKNAQ